MLTNTQADPLGRLREIWDKLDGAPESLGAGLTYARGMHRRPLDYFIARVANLGIRGRRVLDAGCRTGTWSFALRSAFDEVIGLDYTEDRVRVAKWLAEKAGVPGMEFRAASILDTGLPDRSVDAVFCYSVLISSLSAEDTLREFHRVLKPGGVAYVSLNGLGWSFYQRDARGKDDPKFAEMGRQGIYNTLVRSVPQNEINAICVRNGPVSESWHCINWARAKKLTMLQRFGLNGPSASASAVSRARSQLQAWFRYLAPLGLPPSRLEHVAETIREECGDGYYVQLATDVSRMASGTQTGFSYANAGRGYTPAELQTICESVGLIDFQWATEGMIVGAVLPDPPKPVHEGYVGPHLKVWDFLAFRPDDTLGERLSPDWFHVNTARQLRLSYLAQHRLPLLTNVHAATVPRGWVEEARRRAQAAGGNKLIDSLAVKLCEGIDDDEARIARVIKFTQDVLIHHPIVQPFEFNGAAVTDPATLLFLGIGRCGAAAPLVAALCEAAGYPARVKRVPGHVFAVADLGGEEILLETDIFKKDVVPRGADGKLLRYKALLDKPRVVDGLPDFHAWWIIHLMNTPDIWGRQLFGYLNTDADLMIYSSYFEPGVKQRFKPRVPTLKAERDGSVVRLSWSDAKPIDGAEVDYRIAARGVSRGWSYDQEPDDIALILSAPQTVVEEWTDATEIELTAHESAFFEVTPRLKARPEVFCWPSNEVHIPAS